MGIYLFIKLQSVDIRSVQNDKNIYRKQSWYRLWKSGRDQKSLDTIYCYRVCGGKHCWYRPVENCTWYDWYDDEYIYDTEKNRFEIANKFYHELMDDIDVQKVFEELKQMLLAQKESADPFQSKVASDNAAK